MKWQQIALGLGLVVAGVVWAQAQAAWENPKAKIPPAAAPARISGGESFPPLPLPATPVRRTERKREPAPPALVGKITLNVTDGTTVSNYPTVALDIENLMNYTNNQLKLRYRFIETDLTKFSYSPVELPVLYITGWTPLPEIGEPIRQKLREYLMAGGTFVVHANCGRPEFNASFRKFQAQLFPDRPMAPLPLDHAIYSCLNKIKTLKVREGKGDWKEVPAYLEGMYIGCRAAIIYSPIDISWGWDAQAQPIEGGILYAQNDSLQLGANMLTYVLANYEYGRAFENTKIYHQADMATRDQLVVAQLMHNGDWDPTPHGLPNLLKFIDSNSTLNVQFKRVAINLDETDAPKNPILYMTGLRNFALTAKQQAHLRDYLGAGGILFVEAAMGSSAFDESLRKTLAEVLPGSKLEPLPLNHTIFNNVFKLQQVQYSPLVQSVEPDLKTPLLEAVVKDGVPQVIYSRISLSNGWEQLPNPYAKSYQDQDALKLGTNILVYSLTH
ncbi:MAG: DUF4159 domain-containing protein [Phycisphaerae bacterium]